MFEPWERFGALIKFVANCCKPRYRMSPAQPYRWNPLVSNNFSAHIVECVHELMRAYHGSDQSKMKPRPGKAGSNTTNSRWPQALLRPSTLRDLLGSPGFGCAAPTAEERLPIQRI